MLCILLGMAVVIDVLVLHAMWFITGMKMDSSTTNREVTAKDIVSSIICAANRKMQKAKARKTGGTAAGGGNTSPSATTEDSVDPHGSEVKQVSNIVNLLVFIHSLCWTKKGSYFNFNLISH